MARHFYPEKEYRRFIIATFPKPDLAPALLKAYGEIAIDSPTIRHYDSIFPWTIIPCPADTISRGDFLNLMNWLTQGGEAYAAALHPKRSYFALREWSNPNSDTVLVAFSDGTIARWLLPQGLIHDEAYQMLKPAAGLTILPPIESLEAFLDFIDAEELMDYFKA